MFCIWMAKGKCNLPKFAAVRTFENINNSLVKYNGETDIFMNFRDLLRTLQDN